MCGPGLPIGDESNSASYVSLISGTVSSSLGMSESYFISHQLSSKCVLKVFQDGVADGDAFLPAAVRTGLHREAASS